MEHWISCNVAALHFFGGSPQIIVPDNLRIGVTLHTADEVVINRTFQEFGDFYGLAIIPAGVDKPRGKASVEGNVGKIGERIATHLRSYTRNDGVIQKSQQPKWHTEFLQRSGERFRQRAADKIGPWGYKVVDAMLSAGRVEEEGYRPCAQLLNLATKHGGALR